MNRLCKIVNGSVGHSDTAGDDGAYDLLDVTGTPQEIGAAIAASLSEVDLFSGNPMRGRIECGSAIYVQVLIKVGNPDEVMQAEDDEE